MDKPKEFCDDYFRKHMPAEHKQTTIWTEKEKKDVKEIVTEWNVYPKENTKVDFSQYIDKSSKFSKFTDSLPQLQPVSKLIKTDSHYDLFVGAMGYEERTTNAAEALLNMGVHIDRIVLLEFDRYYDATEKRRSTYEDIISKLTSGKTYRPMNAPISAQDPDFAERMKGLLSTLTRSVIPRIIFDCTSCPSVILAQTIKVLLDYKCDLTILYSEAVEYFPTRSEWESGKVKSHSAGRVQGPFAGVRFVAKPPILQSDDNGEFTVLLVLFPTFNTERTDGILAEVDPASRIWFFGEPHDLKNNLYRIDMAKEFASPIMYDGDPWSLLTTFDYRQTIRVLGGIYTKYRLKNRIVIMPHGSKMQTLGTSLFATVHQVSMVFAMPKNYDPIRYSKGCTGVLGLSLGKTDDFVGEFRRSRVVTSLMP